MSIREVPKNVRGGGPCISLLSKVSMALSTSSSYKISETLFEQVDTLHDVLRFTM